MASNTRNRTNFRQRLGSHWVGSWTSWVLFFPFAFITTLTWEADRDFSSSADILIISILVHISCGLVFFVANLTLFRRKETEIVPLWRIFLVFFLFGIVRIVSADFFSDYFAKTNSDLLVRIPAVPFAVVVLITLTLILESISRKVNELKSLDYEFSKAQELQKYWAQNLIDFQNDLLKSINLQALPAIKKVEEIFSNIENREKVTKDNLLNFSQSLKDWNQLLIKTISIAKYQQGKDLLSQNQNLLMTFTPSLTSFKVMNLTKNWDFYPSAIWLPFPVINFILISRFGFGLAFEIYFLSLLASLIFLPAQKYLRPNLQKLHYKTQILSIQVVYLVYGFMLQFILLWKSAGLTQVPFPLWTYLLPVWSLVIMVLVGSVYALTGENGELQKRLLKDVEKLRNQTGESIESIRRIQKMFLNTIHGKIQGKITAATLLIENRVKSLDSEVVPVAVKDELSFELGRISEDAVKDLEVLVLWKENESYPLQSMIENLRKNWLQLIDIKVTIDEPSEHFLENNKWLRSAVEDILSESISNAVRHSKATSVEISATVNLDEDELNLRISNNGELSDADSSGRGVGFSMFEDLGLKFELSTQADETILIVKIPLLQKIQSYNY
jgi:hypothetical protein